VKIETMQASVGAERLAAEDAGDQAALLARWVALKEKANA
jgi:hypothetical protein